MPMRYAARTPPTPDFVVWVLLRWRRFENCKISSKVSRIALVITCFLEVICKSSVQVLSIEFGARRFGEFKTRCQKSSQNH